LAEISDEQLFERHRAGDRAAFRTLIERHRADLLRFLIRLTGDQATAEDVFQEAFLQVHLSADSFDASRRFKPWLFTIAANKGRDQLRKKARRKALDLSAPVKGGPGGDAGATFVDLMEIDTPPPEAAMNDAEQSKRVQQVIDSLPYALREILLLAYFQRLSYAQVADELGIPLGTVKSRLHAAVAAFAKQWKALSESKQHE
jgi:RNA polymerase sigma-70 factor (ECF subfamily)